MDAALSDWDTPPEDGHPGQVFNCRCFAEPLILDALEYVPLSDREFARAISNAELDGNRLANQNALTSLADSLTAIPGFLAATSRFLELREKQEKGDLSDAETAELADMQAVIDARAAGVEAFLKDIPGALTQPFRYRQAIARHADEVAVAYLEGRATEGQLIAAFRDKGFVERSLILGVLPIAAALRLPSGRIGLPALPDREALGQFWRRAIGATEFRRIGADWEVIDNPGIRFGGPIKEQGGPWEDFLENRHGGGFERLHPNFKTYDFQSKDAASAISAKTLNTDALTYQRRPTTIFGRLKRYIDQVESFREYKLSRFEVDSKLLTVRRMELAIPINATPIQRFEIQRAIDYATERGIEVKVTLIGG